MAEGVGALGGVGKVVIVSNFHATFPIFMEKAFTRA